MKVLVIGSGGREHALAWKLRRSPRVTQVYCAPGNAGTAGEAVNVDIAASDTEGLARFAREEGIGLTVVGPDDALAGGIVDRFEQGGLRIFGPTQAAARFESSKIFAKQFMKRHGIPTAAFGHFDEAEEARRFCEGAAYPLVIKADGLALGKGVIIAPDVATAHATIAEVMEQGQFGEAGRRVVIEEFLTGQECSIHAVLDGKTYLLFPGSQDHKAAFDGDTGPNTGGMGTYSPAPLLTPELEEQVRRKIMDPFMAGLRAEGIRFCGLLYPGLMMTTDGPKVLEFNCRFGDPETQVLLPRLKSDLVELLEAAIDGRLDRCTPEWETRAAVCVVAVSGGYPGSYGKGKAIGGLETAGRREDVTVFHAGTAIEDGEIVTSGGRVLGVTALGADIRAARDEAYAAIRDVEFDGMRYRTDIAAKALVE